MDILDSKSDIGGPLYKRMVHYVTNCRNDPNSPILKIQKKVSRKIFFFTKTYWSLILGPIDMYQFIINF